MYSIEFPIRYYECDPMGVVHHSEYIRYFELARNRWLFDNGYTMECCEQDKIVFPVADLHCRYRKSAHFDSTLRATLEVVEFTGARLIVRQTVTELDGTLCAEGEVTLGFLSTVSGRVVRCPERLAALIDKELNTK